MVGQFCFFNYCFRTVKCRKYHSRVCTYCLTYEPACRHSAFSSVLVWTVENAAKTVVWTRIDRCVFDDTENGYFLKRISVDGDLNRDFKKSYIEDARAAKRRWNILVPRAPTGSKFSHTREVAHAQAVCWRHGRCHVATSTRWFGVLFEM